MYGFIHFICFIFKGSFNQSIIGILYSFDIVTFLVMQSVYEGQQFKLKRVTSSTVEDPTANDVIQKTGSIVTVV